MTDRIPLAREIELIRDTIYPETKTVKALPKLPLNVIDWIHKARPFVGGIERTFDWEPFWIEPYEDNHVNIAVGGEATEGLALAGGVDHLIIRNNISC